MSLDVYLEDPTATYETDYLFWSNITHNLNQMAAKAGIYKYLWRPEEIDINKAKDLIKPITNGLNLMKNYPELFKKYDASNGWGTYDQFVPWIEEYLSACKAYPEAKISISRQLVLTKTNIIKKFLYLVLIWYTFTNASEKSETWIVFYEDEKSIHKCKREDYLELMEMIEYNETQKPVTGSLIQYRRNKKERKEKMNQILKEI